MIHRVSTFKAKSQFGVLAIYISLICFVEETGIKKGYCLVLDCGTGRLAFELAKRTELKIIGVENDAKKVEKAKKMLDAAGLFGHRVVVEQWEPSELPVCRHPQIRRGFGEIAL